MKHWTALRRCGVEHNQCGGGERRKRRQIEREGARYAGAVVVGINPLDRVVGHEDDNRPIRIAEAQRVGIKAVHGAGVIDPKAAAR